MFYHFYQHPTNSLYSSAYNKVARSMFDKTHYIWDNKNDSDFEQKIRQMKMIHQHNGVLS